MKLYDWQKQIVEHKGNLTIRGGRQTGKSESCADRIFKIAHDYPGCKILVIAASERQENYLMEKVKDRLGKKYKFKSRATTTRLPLANGTMIYKFPIGQTGIYVEGMSSVDFLFVDEAIHIGRKVWDSIIPMLAEPRNRGLGWITLLSTTRGRTDGFFYESFKRDDFLKIHIKAEDCPHVSKEFLNEEHKRLGDMMYNIIYNGEFDENAYKYFSPEIIERQALISVWSMADYKPNARYYLGVDPARFGKSKAAFCVAELDNDFVRIVHEEVLKKSSLLDLQRVVYNLDNKFRFRKIFIDDGGVGAGLIDILDDIKKRVRRLNNAEKSRSKQKGEIKNKILKEDLYSNANRLMEMDKIHLLKRPEFLNDLMKVEYDEEDKIEGTDRSEAFVRACWCTKEKGLKLYLY